VTADLADANRAIDSAQATDTEIAALRGVEANDAAPLPATSEKAGIEKPGRVASAGGTGAQTIQAPAPQLSSADLPAVAHVPLGAQGTASVISGHDGEASTSGFGPAAGTTAADTFAALDSATGAGRLSWIHAGGQRAEAGFEDPALGWVGVRADLSGGAVHAVLVPGSAEAAQVLSAHLPGLSAYLSEQHAPVAALTMAAEGGEAGSWPGQNMGQSAGQNAGQNGSAETQTHAQAELSMNSHRETKNGTVESGTQSAALIVEMSGTYISVMA
jgi:hypothetical protein